MEIKYHECFKIFSEHLSKHQVSHQHALESVDLYKMYLDKCGNHLLVKLLNDGSHMGRCGSSNALIAFKTIWYVTLFDQLIISVSLFILCKLFISTELSIGCGYKPKVETGKLHDLENYDKVS